MTPSTVNHLSRCSPYSRLRGITAAGTCLNPQIELNEALDYALKQVALCLAEDSNGTPIPPPVVQVLLRIADRCVQQYCGELLGVVT